MIVTVGVGAVCLAVGAAVSHWLTRRACRKHAGVPLADDQDLTDQDREQLAAEFADHVSAVRRQVGAFADDLAGSDVLLRERLRMFEAGDRS